MDCNVSNCLACSMPNICNVCNTNYTINPLYNNSNMQCICDYTFVNVSNQCLCP